MTFEWGRTAGRAKVDGPRIFADEKHPRAFGAAMAMNRAYATRDLSQYCQWTLKSLKTGQSYIGICDGRAELDCQPTSGSFGAFVAGFGEWTGGRCHSSGQLRYWNRGASLGKWATTGNPGGILGAS